MIKVLVAVTCLLVSMASWSTPVTVEVGGTFYDVTTIEGSFKDNFTQLTNQVWWVDSDVHPNPESQIALAFADAVGDSLGLRDCGPSAKYPLCAPIFVFQLLNDVPPLECGLYTCAFIHTIYQPQSGLPARWTANGCFDNVFDCDSRMWYAVATPSQVPVPLPATAWLFGSALVGLVALGRRKKALV